MKVYMYDKVTKEYIGTTIAYKDKVASIKKRQDIFLIPAYTTDIEPPETGENEVAIFYDNCWKVVPDYRNKTIYNINTREKTVCDTIGELPKGYTLKLVERLEDIKDEYLTIMKNSFIDCVEVVKLKIPSTELYFTYNSVERLKKEQSTGIVMSRDDNNKIYMLTRQEYDVIINYLVVFGQYMYLQKWALENTIKKCSDIEVLKTYKDKLNIRVDQRQINNLVKMNPEERKAYFVRIADNIK